MSKRAWIFVAFLLALIAIPFVLIRTRTARLEATLRDQLTLARQEGIPTTAEDIRSTIRPAAASENAAPLYRLLTKGYRLSDETSAISKQLLLDPTPKARENARAFIRLHQDRYRIIDKAVSYPYCWFDRKWEEGSALLLPELADMKWAAKFLALRGTLATVDDDPRSAIADAQKIFTIASHARQEPLDISQLVSETIYFIGLRSLANWAAVSANHREYRLAFDRARHTMPTPDLRKENALGLYNALSLIDLLETRDGPKKIGIRREDFSNLEKVAPLIFNRGEAKINMVKAYRKYWAALKDPVKNDAALSSSMQEFYGAMLAYPTAADIYTKLSGELTPTDRFRTYKVRSIQMAAISRALEANAPKSIKTSDLKSPYNGKPLKYGKQGKQMTFTVAGGEGESIVRVPAAP